MKADLKFLFVIFGTILIFSPPNANSSKLTITNEWAYLDYEFPSEEARNESISNGDFIIGAPLPIDVFPYYTSAKNRITFVTVPRFGNAIEGTPATLATVTDKKRGNATLLKPFPNWDWHTNPKQCKTNRLVSPYRIDIDQCGRMWVIDSGALGEAIACQPQVLAFDVETGELLHKYEIPRENYNDLTVFVTIAADVRDAECKDTFIYLADVLSFQIVIYDVKNNASWNAKDRSMYPYPNLGVYDILGDEFISMDGVIGLALMPYQTNVERILYYHAMCNPYQSWVRTSDLRNQSMFAISKTESPQVFNTFKHHRSSQSATNAISKDGIMFFSQLHEVLFSCWNTNTTYEQSNWGVVSNDTVTMQYPSGVHIVQNGDEEELWVITDRFQQAANGSMKLSNINFRIMYGNVSEVVAGTICNS